MTKQEIFNKVAIHLIRQGDRAINDRGICAYRGHNGTKCAVGILITDEMYKKIREASLKYLVADAIGLGNHINFLVKLQRLHDMNSSWFAGMKRTLEIFAREEGLKMPVVEKIKGDVR